MPGLAFSVASLRLTPVACCWGAVATGRGKVTEAAHILSLCLTDIPLTELTFGSSSSSVSTKIPLCFTVWLTCVCFHLPHRNCDYLASEVHFFCLCCSLNSSSRRTQSWVHVPCLPPDLICFQDDNLSVNLSVSEFVCICTIHYCGLFLISKQFHDQALQFSSRIRGYFWIESRLASESERE